MTMSFNLKSSPNQIKIPKLCKYLVGSQSRSRGERLKITSVQIDGDTAMIPKKEKKKKRTKRGASTFRKFNEKGAREHGNIIRKKKTTTAQTWKYESQKYIRKSRRGGTCKHGNKQIQHGNREIRKYGNKEIWKHGNTKNTENTENTEIRKYGTEIRKYGNMEIRK